MRIFPKLFLLLVAVAVLPLGIATALLVWQANSSERYLATRIVKAERMTTGIGQRSLYGEASHSHMRLVQDKAHQLEASFETSRRAVLLQTDLAASALVRPPVSGAPPLHRASQVAAWKKKKGGFFKNDLGKSPYSIYHVPAGVSQSAVSGGLARMRALGNFFAFNQKSLPLCRSIFFGSEDGFIIGYPGGSPFKPEYDPRKRPWYQQAKEKGRLVITDLYLNKSKKDLLLTYAQPVYTDKGKFLGVSAMDVDVTKIVSNLFDLEGLPVKDAVLIDGEGIVRLSASYGGSTSDGRAQMQNLSVAEYLDGRFQAVFEKIRENDGKMAGIYTPGFNKITGLPPLKGDLFTYSRVLLHTSGDNASENWYYVVQTSMETLLRPVDDMKKSFVTINEELAEFRDGQAQKLAIGILATILILSLLVVGAGYFSAKAVTKPLEHISDVVQRISSGDFDRRVGKLPPDEIGEVGRAINEMAEGLKEGHFIKDTFKRYVPASVVDQLIKEPGKVTLGGVKRDLTVFFSDVAGFTSLSEELDPEKLVELINEFMSAMTVCIFDQEGTLDKYEGDAIMAFWGAPVGQLDHARRACRAALACFGALKIIQVSWEKRGLPHIDMRIGLCTGPMVVGNMGSMVRMEYTVLGDSVNLGARLEEANKLYGTRIMMSESTFKDAGDTIEAREIDLLAVRGRKQATRVYELLGIDGMGRKRAEGHVIFGQALKAYRAQEWGDAESLFKKADSSLGGDRVSQVFLSRINHMRQVPPQKGWNGVFVASAEKL